MPVKFYINYLSKPDYDDWGIDDYWSCADWVEWHRQLKAYYGIEQANRIFIEAFQGAGQLSASYDCRSFNSDFRQYAKDNGFYDALYSGISGLVVQPIGWGTDVVDDTGNVIDNITSTVSSASSIIRTAVPLLLITLFVFLILYSYTKATAA